LRFAVVYKMILNFARMKKYIFIALSYVLLTVNLFGQYNSVLSEGKWFKISTNKSGIYKLDYSSILSLGVAVNNLQISSIKLYGNGDCP
jgi:hypothetical protein